MQGKVHYTDYGTDVVRWALENGKLEKENFPTPTEVALIFLCPLEMMHWTAQQWYEWFRGGVR